MRAIATLYYLVSNLFICVVAVPFNPSTPSPRMKVLFSLKLDQSLTHFKSTTPLNSDFAIVCQSLVQLLLFTGVSGNQAKLTARRRGQKRNCSSRSVASERMLNVSTSVIYTILPCLQILLIPYHSLVSPPLLTIMSI